MPDNKQGSGRGFASMDENKQREIASQGGKASSDNFSNDRERATETGRKGGQQSSGGRGSEQDSRGGSESGQQQAESGGDRQQRSGSGESGSENERDSGSKSGRKGLNNCAVLVFTS